ncbi:MAG: hypothetical protein JXX14_14475 [Deltaproteobacteria bacterium]|nr:hypothetical protein [Deltaproteobacteria bacterium]
MNRLKKAAIITRLARKMRDKDSWCGETHLQKGLYLAQELLDVPTAFEFILYKHGPFSFGFREELGKLRADGLLDLEPQPRPFGPRFLTTKRSKEIEARFPRTIDNVDEKLNFIAGKLGGKGVSDLEKLATALFVTKNYPDCSSITMRAEKLHELKPHVSISDAQTALEQISEFQTLAQDLMN